MASRVLYPPLVDTYAAAFVSRGNTGECNIYFSLSKLSSNTESIKSIHISVIKQSSGKNVVNKVDNEDNNRYRSSGIIIVNLPNGPVQVENKNNIYSISLTNEDIKGGWEIGCIYKIQIRLSTVLYSNDQIGQMSWLNINANNFSEWSTYCVTKAIGKSRIIVPTLKFDSDINIQSDNKETINNISLSTIEFVGDYSNVDVTENLYSYKLKLFNKKTGELEEESDILYTNQFTNPNQFYYLFKTELQDNNQYSVELSYTTINKYHDTLSFNFEVIQAPFDDFNLNICTIDNFERGNFLKHSHKENIEKDIYSKEYIENFKLKTSLEEENNEGRIGLKLHTKEDHYRYTGNICIRRTDSKSNFKIWSDIKIIPIVDKLINEMDIIWDYTIESGVWYKYAIQTIDTNGDRSIALIMNDYNKNIGDITGICPIIRHFEYSYLLGEEDKQLKLNFNNALNSYTYNYSESKKDTIGGKYPFIQRNGNMKYRTFSLSGLISFNMDDMKTFIHDEKDIYMDQDIVDKYLINRKELYYENAEYSSNPPYVYDYKREFDFREEVLSFLQDGKPKLFKSATEGNILVYLMGVSLNPEQALNRMIGTFNATAIEIAESNLDNYIKYNLCNIGTYLTSFQSGKTKIGQLYMDFLPGDDIISKIWEKYDKSSYNIAGNRYSLYSVHHLSLQFESKPLQIQVGNDDLALGNQIEYNNGNSGSSIITVFDIGPRYYYFDENILFMKSSSLIVRGSKNSDENFDSNGNIKPIKILVDFLYDELYVPYEDKKILSRTVSKNIGQIYGNYNPYDDIYNKIYYKYFYDWSKNFGKLSRLLEITIEANPGACFLIGDTEDSSKNYENNIHQMNETGILHYENIGDIIYIKYIGMRVGNEIKKVNCDVKIDYLYYKIDGTYE